MFIDRGGGCCFCLVCCGERGQCSLTVDVVAVFFRLYRWERSMFIDRGGGCCIRFGEVMPLVYRLSLLFFDSAKKSNKKNRPGRFAPETPESGATPDNPRDSGEIDLFVG